MDTAKLKFIIAIDGPSGVGKSTVARAVAEALGYMLIDTGALYRTLAWLADRAQTSWEDGEAVAALAEKHGFTFTPDGRLAVDGQEMGDRIRTPHMSKGASTVSKHPAVRAALLGLQRKLGESGGVVLEGRDIGTVVFPGADFKFFLTASAEVRAERRRLELANKGHDVAFDEVLRDQIARDQADSSREIAPLRKANDAIEVSTDHLLAPEVAERMLSVIRSKSR